MNIEEFKKNFECNFEPDTSFEGTLKWVRNADSYDVARYIAQIECMKRDFQERIEDLYEKNARLQEDLENAISERKFVSKRYEEAVQKLGEMDEYIYNLKRASQDYCMCGELIDKHGVLSDHVPMSEFDHYIKENKL